jgi:nicotinamide-nucleotide amidase
MSLRLEIISIGDEILMGQTVNTNASWMGMRLVEIGIKPCWITTIGDDARDLNTALEQAEERADVILITGGLGPTHDDITKSVTAEYFQSDMEINKDILAQVTDRFRRRGISMAKVNESQAQVPQKARLMSNDRGTAPGFVFDRNDKHFYIMPGVPHEMKSMMNRFVLPELSKSLTGLVTRIRMLATTGIPESTLYEELGDISQIEKFAKMAFLPNLKGVRIRLTSQAESEKDAVANLDHAEAKIREHIDEFIYADQDIEIEEALAHWLRDSKKRIAVAESCTGGLLMHRLTNVPGSSHFFERGICSYSNESKVELLNVSKKDIETHGAVSETVALQMAKGIRKLTSADYGLSTTGIAGPSGGTKEKPVGLVFIGLADERGAIVEKFTFGQDRTGNKIRSTQAALDLLRRRLLDML